MSDIHDKVRNGEYKNKEVYPDSKLKKSNPDVYKELQRQYHLEEKRLYDQFRMDLEADYGMSNHPIKDAIFSQAWAHGHSSGYYEVSSVYGDLYENIVESMNKYIKQTFGVTL